MNSFVEFTTLFHPGKLLNTVTLLLFAVTFIFMLSMFLAFSTFMYKYWIFVHIPLLLVSSFVLQFVRVYDPRKPLPLSNFFWMKYTRKFCIFTHIMEQIVLFIWTLSITYPKERTYIIIETSLMGFMILFRFLLFIWFYFKEIGENKKVSGLFFAYDYIYLAIKIAILIISLSKFKKDVYDFVILCYILTTPLYSLCIMSVFYGFFREPVRQHQIQIPQPAVLADNHETLERAPSSVCEMV